MANKVKKYIFAWGLLLFVTSGIAAEEKDFSISVSSYVMNGTINEYVFDADTPQSDHLMSELDWDILNIPVIEFDFDKYFKKVYLNGSLAFGVSKESGYMQDYDWLNYQYPAWENENPDEITNYSVHTNTLKQYFDFAISAGWSFEPSKSFEIIPLAEYNFNYIDLDGADGYSVYKTDNFKKRSFSGRVISYKQRVNAFSLGCILNSSFSIFGINNYFSISPYLTAVDAYDYHWLRKRLFYDMINSPFKITEKLSFSVTLKEKFKLSLLGNLSYIPVSTGKDYVYFMNSKGQPTSSATYSGDSIPGGTRRFTWGLGLAAGIQF